MAAQVLPPDYSMLANAPQPGVGTAISSGLQAYGQISKIQKSNQMLQLAKQQEQRQQASADQEKQVRDLQIYTAKRGVVDNRLADIYQTPEDQKEAEYQKFKKDSAALGLNHESLPDHYNDDIAAESETAYKKSSQAAASRLNENKVHLKKMDILGKQQAAQITGQASIEAAKQKATTQVDIAKQKAQIAAQAAPQQEMQKAEAASFTDELKKVNDAANFGTQKTLPTVATARQMVAEYAKSGPVGGKIAWSTTAGQKLALELNKLQLREFQKTHNVRSPREYDKIVSSVGTIDMYPSTLYKALDDLESGANSDVERQKFYNDDKKRGSSPNEIQINWNKKVKDKLDFQYSPKFKAQRQQADLEHTAKMHGMTVEQVKQQLGAQ